MRPRRFSALESSTGIRIQDAAHAEWLAYYRDLLKLRREIIVPRLRGMDGHAWTVEVFAPKACAVRWHLGDGSTLRLLANFSDDVSTRAMPAGQTVFASSTAAAQGDAGSVGRGVDARKPRCSRSRAGTRLNKHVRFPSRAFIQQSQ